MSEQKNMRTVPFSPPDISDLEIKEVVDVLKSGWITTGAKTKQFEREIASYCHTNKAVCLNSQTICAEMALRILGIEEDDEIIVPAYTYTASASVVCHLGAKLVFVDSQKDSIEMDYDQLEKLINKNTKVIIPVDVGGVPCDYDRIFDIVNQKKHLFCPKNDIQKAMGRISVNSDSSHSFGSIYKGKTAGSIADFSAFSFHAVKNLTTAEGGALTWNNIPEISDDEIYHKAQLLSLHGQSKDALTKTKLGSWEYDIVGPWYKCNMTDVQAAIGVAQLHRYDYILNKRKNIINKYDDVFKPMGIKVLDHYNDTYNSSGHLYITRIPGISIDERQEIIIKMAEKGISCNVHYKPLPMMTAYKNLGFDIKDYPNAYKHFENEITLPLHTCLDEEDVDYVIDNYKDIVGDYIH